MQAAVRERYGSPDVVEVRDIDRPIPADDQVLVRVQAASVNRGDLDGIEPQPSFVRLFIGLRAPGHHRLYERLGWRTWQGPTSVRTPNGEQRTPEDNGSILVLETLSTPIRPLDLRAPISCDWRTGDVW